LSCGSANNDLEEHRSRLIDKELRADRKRYRSTYRLLLLGNDRLVPLSIERAHLLLIAELNGV